MLNRVAWQTSMRGDDPRVPLREEPIIDLTEMFRALRRRQALIVGSVAFAIFSAVIYLAITPPHYIASSMLLFEVRKIEPFQQQGQNAATDSAFVDSQVEVLKSENIAKSVVRDLDLLSEPEFAPPKGGLLDSILGFTQRLVKSVHSAGNASVETDQDGKGSVQADQFGRVVRMFRRNLTIKRVGLTYLISVDYQSPDPNKAAWISNAVAEAYLLAEQNSKYQAARRANAWLEDRITELRSLAQSTERAVAEYKAKNTVVDPRAAPLNEQQLAEVSTQRRLVLQDLESSARTYRALHETLLQRIGEFTQQQSFPATEARVVSQASPPLEKSGPKTLLTLGIASLLGLVGGLGAAFAREYLDGSFRSSRQIEKEVGIDCLGTLPMIAPSRPWFPKWRRDPASGDRVISTSSGLHRFVTHEPLSRFSETIRSLKVAADAADLHRPNGVKVIGVTSARRHEGKSLVAANLSEMIAISGCKVLLIDCGLHNGGLTEQFAPQAQSGLMEVIAGQAPLKDFVWRDPSTDLNFLPAVKIPTDRDLITKEKLSPTVLLRRTHLSPMALKTLLQSVHDTYDYVVLDLPPIAPTADVKAISHLVDAFFLVIEFGRTSQQAVVDALNAATPVLEKLLGAVLNKADPKELKRSEA
jgi:capsular exopolysaccharide synthesis family protein